MGHLPTALAIGPATAALVKIAIWAIGVGYAVYFRRALFTAGATIAMFTGGVRGFQDADGHLPTILSQSVVYWSTPTAALIVTAFVAGRYEPVWIGRGWRL